MIFDRRTGKQIATVTRFKLIGRAAMDEKERFETQMRRDAIAARIVNKIAADLDKLATSAADGTGEPYDVKVEQLENAVVAMFSKLLAEFVSDLVDEQKQKQQLESPGIGADRRAGGDKERAG